MTLIYIYHEPYRYMQLTKPTAVCSPNRVTYVGRAGDYIMIDRWMNANLVSQQAMEEFLDESARMLNQAMDGLPLPEGEDE